MVMDTHLMITDPLKYAEEFKKAGSDYITFHYEAVDDVELTIKEIKKIGVKVGISIKPNTSVEVLDKYLDILDLVLVMSVNPGFGGQKFIPRALDKIKCLDQWRKDENLNFLIEVDGGVTLDNAVEIAEAGADILVAGSAVFGVEDIIKRTAEFKNL
jgi:ribulose-phosphate 3-epimerase